MSSAKVSRQRLQRDAAAIAASFSFIGVSWFVVVDVLAMYFIALPVLSPWVKMLFTCIFIAITGGLIYYLVLRVLRRTHETMHTIAAGRDELQATSQRLADLLTASATILHVQRHGEEEPLTTWVSENVERITGFTSKEALVPGWWKAHVHPDDLAAAIASYKLLLAEGEVRIEYRFMRKDGTIIWVLDLQRVAESKTSSDKEIIGAWTDISERKVAEVALSETTQRLSDLLTASPTVVYAFQFGEGLPAPTFVSENVERITGYRPDEALRSEWWPSHVHPEDQMVALGGHTELLAKGSLRQEYRFLHKDGHTLWVLDEQRLITGRDGQPSEIVGAWTDISDRKLAEVALWNTNAILQGAMDQSQSGIIIADAPSGKLRYANEAALRIRGKTAGLLTECEGVEQYAAVWQLYGLDGVLLTADEDPLARAVRYGDQSTRELIMRRNENDDRYIVSNAAPIVNAEGKVEAAIVVFLDITERKRIAAESHATEDRYIVQRNALASLTGLHIQVQEDLTSALQLIMGVAAKALGIGRTSVWLLDEGQTRLECLCMYEMTKDRHTSGLTLSLSEAPFYTRSLSEGKLISSDDVQRDLNTIELFESYHGPLGITSAMDVALYNGQDLKGIVCHEHIGPLRHWSEDEKSFAAAIGNLVSLVLEVWERRKTEFRLRAAKQRLQRAIGASKVGLWDWDVRNNTIQYIPEGQTEKDLDCEEVTSSFDEWVALIHPDDAERAKRYVAQFIAHPERGYSQEFRLRFSDGQYHWILAQGTLEVDSDGLPVRILGSHVDITERKRLEMDFIQAQKMESVGRLAGGVAHDFNNLLTVISGYTEMALGSMAESDPLHHDLSQVRRAADRAALLTRQLLAFSRKQVLRPELINLNEIVADAETMLKRLVGEDILFTINTSADLGQVVADPGQMEQVIMNLVINARDAMPTGGQIIIETMNVSYDEKVTLLHVDIAPGSYVCIVVSDTGTGMDAETQEKIFEPFFTTKSADKGTGLGLATVYGIVKQSGGSVVLYSELGKGTTFKVFLPLVEVSPLAVALAPAQARPTLGIETILVVEDESNLRLLVERFLVQAGYKVLTAADGETALTLVANKETHIDLVLTDVVMPGMSGRELADKLSERHPALKVLYMSGYTDTAISVHGVLEHGTHLINKPFTPAQLTGEVRKVLDEVPA